MPQTVLVKEDFALLDKGLEERNPFVLITDVEVDDNGELVDPLLGARVMSNEAVRKGAIRINQSDCVDMDNALEAYNDQVVVFNGGDKYEVYDFDWAREVVQDYSPKDRDRALEYITHRENRYHFLKAQGMFIDEYEPSTRDTKSFLDDVKGFLGLGD